MVATSLPALSGTSGATSTTVQGESMGRPTTGTSILHERSAAGGRALRFLRNRTATSRMRTTFAVASVVVRARGQMFQGAPVMAVSVNGARATRVTVSRSSYGSYVVPVHAAAGTYSVAISFVNDYHRRGYGDRNLVVDQLTLRSAPVRSAHAQPGGQRGSWRLTFDDEFNGTSLDLSKWSPMEGASMNNVTTHASNIAVSGGNLILTLASSRSGAFLSSAPSDGAGAHGYLLPVGSFAEARMYFPGNGTSIYNWPAWWTSGPDWPAAGEHDIAEGLGTLTVNYHSPSGAHNGMVAGTWSNAFHTYGLYRGHGYANVYWDGRLVRHYSTDDNGAPESLLFNVGAGNTAAFGVASRVRVDYVRAWGPA